MDDLVVKKRVTINATNSEVWQALTDPRMTKKYFFNCAVFSTWREGDPITFKGKIFWIKKIEMKGRILSVEPGRLLKYTLQNSSSNDPESFSTITDELRFHRGETILTITDDVGKGEDAERRYRRSMKGWDKVLKGLKEMMETEKPTVYFARK